MRRALGGAAAAVLLQIGLSAPASASTELQSPPRCAPLQCVSNPCHPFDCGRFPLPDPHLPLPDPWLPL